MNTSESNRLDPLRVLLVSCMPPPSGGIGRWAILLLDWLSAQPRVSLKLVPLSPSWRAVWDTTLWKRVVGGGLQGVWDAGRVFSELVTFRPQILHLNTSAELRGPWDTGILAVAALLGIRTFYHIHMGRLPEVIKRRGWEWWLLRWALKLAERVVVLDKGSEEALKRILPAERVVRMPNAIAAMPPTDLHAERGEPSVLFLGHLVAAKGMQELMEAWRELRPQGWRLRLAGPGQAAYQKELQRIAGQNAAVEFLGELPPDAAWRCMQATDIFVLPTHTEGFPNVILEAMAAGKAIICTRVGAVPEMLEADGNEPCGLVIPARDTQALSNALAQLLLNPQLRETLGRRALARLNRCYTTDIVFGQLLSLWHGASRQELSPGERTITAVAR